MISFLRHSLAVLGACVIAGSAMASPVTFNFTQTVTEIRDPLGRFAAAGIGLGTVLTGSVTYESTTTNLLANTGNQDTWMATSMVVNYPAAMVSLADPVISATDLSTDSWRVRGTNSTYDFGHTALARGNFGYQSVSASDPLYVGLGLGHPVIGVPVFDTPFTSGGFLSYRDLSSISGITGNANLSTTFLRPPPVAPVPLPAALPMMLVALAGVAGLARRARRAAA